MKDFRNEYRQKLRSPEEAVAVVKDGDWIDYTSCLGKPILLDRALAKRRDELHDVKIRGNLMAGPIAGAECDETSSATRSRRIFSTTPGTARRMREGSAIKGSAIIFRWFFITMLLIMNTF